LLQPTGGNGSTYPEGQVVVGQGVLVATEADRNALSGRESGAWSRRRRRPAADALSTHRVRSGFWNDAYLRRLLALGDGAAALTASLVLAVASGGHVDTGVWALVFLPVWIVLAKLHGLYDADQHALRHLTVDELPTLAVWAIIGTVSIAVLVMATPAAEPTLAALVWAAGAAFFGACLLRGVARSSWRRLTPAQATLVVGDGPLADAVRRKLELFPDTHTRTVDNWSQLTIERLAEAPWWHDLDRIILASDVLDERLLAELLSFCRTNRIKLSVVPPARGMFGTAVHLDHIAELPIIQYNTWDVSRSTVFLKRVMDVVGSSIALVLLSPVFPVVALAIKLDSRGPVFFSQLRAGKGGRPYRMHKFRTMTWDAEDRLRELVSIDSLTEPMFKFQADPRRTRVGCFFRRWSIDEIPQLYNVLRGDMSLVGPRPEQFDLVERYTPAQQFRLQAKPGITGPMQVYGRGDLTFDERLAVERDYIENLSVGRDLRLLVMTIGPIFSGKGAY
jgi:exopolysaccharide biosynthesis polyprenyl glycosylphosphotransferase